MTDKPKNEAAEMIWPIEARDIDDARRIWAERGFTTVQTMTRDELKKRFGLIEREKERKK